MARTEDVPNYSPLDSELVDLERASGYAEGRREAIAELQTWVLRERLVNLATLSERSGETLIRALQRFTAKLDEMEGGESGTENAARRAPSQDDTWRQRTSSGPALAVDGTIVGHAFVSGPGLEPGNACDYCGRTEEDEAHGIVDDDEACEYGEALARQALIDAQE